MPARSSSTSPLSTRRAARLPVRRGGCTLRPVALAVAALVLLAGGRAALAGPAGGTVVQGQASISAPSPLRTEIRQTTDRAAIDWQGFSVGAGESVRIQQPGAGSVLFNRVTGGDPSVILGQLQANGRVFLSNPRGIVFGAGSQVDVGGLVATTLVPRDGVWRSDTLDLVTAPGGSAALQSDGRISAPGGTVVLAAPVLAHGGSIDARRVGLAAAGAVAVDVEGDGRIFFRMSDEGLANRLSVLGQVRADGGTAELRAAARAGVADTVLNLEGVVRARGLGQRDGRIVIDGGGAGLVRVAGTLDASSPAGAGGTGGSVQVEGQRLLLDADALVDVSGDTGGGSAKLGGGMRGSDLAVRNADMLVMAEGAQVHADARAAGHGGEVVLWSESATRFAGGVTVRGGATGGAGGTVEVSSHGWLDFRGVVDTSAPAGAAGTLLLDPLDIVISSDPPDVNGDGVMGDDLQGSTLFPNTFQGKISHITPAAIERQAGGLVHLSAERDLYVESPVTMQPDTDLHLAADNAVHFNASVSARGLTVQGASATTIKKITLKAGAQLTGSSLLWLRGAEQMTLAGTLESFSLVVIGNWIDFSGDVVFAVGGGGGGNLVGVVAGDSGRLVKRGSGSLGLDDPAWATSTIPYSHKGGTLVEAGTLTVKRADLLPANGQVEVAAGAALLLGGSQSIGGLTGAGDVATTAFPALPVRLLLAPSGDASFSGRLQGVNELALQGSGSQTFTGPLNVGRLTVLAGTTRLSGVASFNAGQVQLDGGTLDLGDGAVVKAPFVLQSGTLMSSSGTGRLEGSNQTAGNSAGLHVAAASGAEFVLATDSLSLGANTLDKDGAGTVRLQTSGAMSLGDLSIHGGTLQIASAGPVTATRVALEPSTFLNLSGTTELSRLEGSGTVTVAAGDLKVGAAGADFQFDGTITGAGAVIKQGTGTFTLGGQSTYSGGTFVEAGSLVAQQQFSLPERGDVHVAAGALLQLGSQQAIGGLSGDGSVDLGGNALFQGPLTDARFGGHLFNGQLVMAGPATQTFTGPLDLDLILLYGGGLRLDGPTALATVQFNTTLIGGTLDVANGAVLRSPFDFDGSATLTTSQGRGRVEGNYLLTPSVGLDVSLSAGANAQLDIVTDQLPLSTFNVAKDGAGTVSVTASGAANLGNLMLNRGTLQLSAAGGAAAAGVVMKPSTSLDLVDGTVLASSQVAVTGPATLASSANGGRLVGSVIVDGELLVDVGSGSRLDLQGDIVQQGGSGDVTKAGAGELAQDGLLQTGGRLWLQDGTWSMLRSEALSALSAVQVDASATLSLPGSTHLRVLTGSGTVSAAAGELALGGAGDSFNFGGRVTGGTTLVKEGSGTLTLSGPSDHSGGTQVRAGTLAAAAVWGPLSWRGPLPLSGDVEVAAGALLNVQTPQQIGGLTGAGDVTVSGPFWMAPQGESVFTGRVLNGPLIIVNGSGTQTLAGEVYANQLVANAGVLRLAGTGVSGSFHGALNISGGTVDLVDGASLQATLNFFAGTLASSRGNGRFAGPQQLSGRRDLHFSAGEDSRLDVVTDTLGALSPALSKVGPGVVGLSLSTPNELGTLTVNEGVFELSAAASMSATRVVLRPATRTTLMGDTVLATPQMDVAGPATLATAGGSNALMGPINVNGNFTLDVPGGTLVLGGDITDTGGLGTLTKLGAGTLSLPSAAVRTHGTLALQQGTLQFGAANPLPDVSGVDTNAGTLLQFGADAALQALTGAGSVMLDNGAALHLGGSGASVSFAGDIAGNGSLHKDGAGTFAWSGTGRYSSGTFVHGGVLLLSGAGSLPAGGALQVDAGAVLATDGSLQLGGLVGAGQVQVDGVLTVGLDDVDSRFDGTLVGAGSLLKAGAGTFTLSGAAAQQGGTQVAAGTLLTLGAERLPDGARVQVDAGALLHLGGNETIGSLAGAGTVLADAGAVLATGGDGSSSTLSGALTAGTLVKQGGGTFTLSGAVTVDTLDLRAGTLQLAGAGAQATAALAWLSQGATLDLSDGAQLQAQQLTAFAGTLSNGSGDGRFSGSLLLNDTLTLAVDGTLTLAGDVVSGFFGAGLRKTGGGTLVVDSQLQHDGGTDVLAGRLVARGDDRLSPASAVTVAAGAAGAALDLQGRQHMASLDVEGTVTFGADAALQALTGAGSVMLDNGAALHLGGSGASFAFAGDIAGNGSLHKDGAGTFTWSGVGGYTSGTFVHGGVLLLSGAGSLPAGGSLQVDAGARLASGGALQLGALTGAGQVQVDGELTVGLDDIDSRFDGSLVGAGSLVKQGAGAFMLAGTVTLDTLDLRAGTLQLAGAGAQASVASAWLAQDSTLDLSDGAQLQAQQLMAFAGTLSNRSGDGRFSGSLLLNDTLTLAVDGNTLTLAGDVVSGFFGAGLRKTGGGTLVVDSQLQHDGGTDVLAGRLVARGDDRLSPASAVTVAAGAALDLQGRQHMASLDAEGTVTLGGSLHASGDLRLAGGATVTATSPVTLSGRSMEAMSDANRWGAQPLSLVATGGVLDVSAGRDSNGAWRDLRLQDVQAAAGGRLDGGRLMLDGTLVLAGGTLLLDAHAPATYGALSSRRLPNGVPVALADDAITQSAGSLVITAAGSLLSLRSEAGGSITLAQAGNDWQGGLQALSGPAFGTAWASNLQTLNGQTVSGQGRITIAGGPLSVAGEGIEADLVRLVVPSTHLDPGARIVQRLPADALPADAQAAIGVAQALRLDDLQRDGEVEAGDGASAAQAMRLPPPCDPRQLRGLRCLAPRERAE